MIHELKNLNLITPKPYQFMHLIYSALRDLDQTSDKHFSKDNSEIQLRYRAYAEACNKHRQHITEIQKYFPNWMPKPPAP